MPKPDNLVGQKFNKLLVLRKSDRKQGIAILWWCLCDCGYEYEVSGRHLKGGQLACKTCSFSVHRKHGLSKIPEHSTWRGMIGRCYNKNNPAYSEYGGRGITVDNRWLGEDGFSNFLSDMGRRPSKKHSIDRKRNNKGYSKANCRWATKEEQSRNRRNNIYVRYNGKRTLLAEVAKSNNLSYRLVYKRHVQKGWTIKESLVPSLNKSVNLTHNGETLNLADWARRLNISDTILSKRLSRGWSVQETLSLPATRSNSVKRPVKHGAYKTSNII